MAVKKRKSFAVPPDVRAALDEHQIDVAEEIWIARMESNPQDVDFFLGTAAAFEKAGVETTATSLLELLDDQLVADELWDERLTIMRHLGDLFLKSGRVHPTIMETVKNLYGDLPSFDQFVDKVGLLKGVDDIPKIWKKVDRLKSLVAFDIGTIVRVEGKGAGRVTEVNMTLDNFKIELETMVLRVGFAGAAKLIHSVPPEHVLYRKIVAPEELEALRDSNASELLRRVLQSYDGPRTGAQVKADLYGIVTEKGWSRWWTAARKHPQVLAAPGKKHAYTWVDSSEDANDAVLQAFEAADTRKRIALLRRDASRDDALKRRMSEVLMDDATRMVSVDPGIACEIWFYLEKHGFLPQESVWNPQRLIGETDKPQALFDGIKDRSLRERAYALARQQRDDAPKVLLGAAWQEPDARALDGLSAALLEDEPSVFDGFFDQLVSQPRKNPAAFTWLVERAADRPEWLARNPSRLLKQMLWSLAQDSFAPFRAARLVPLCESGGTLARLIPHLDLEQAEQAFEAVEKAIGLEDYQRNPLLRAIELKFPSLRKEDVLPLYATSDRITAKKAELKRIAEEEIPANRQAIEEARELGDLRENFEYKSARQRHEYLSARAFNLKNDLERARPIDPSQVSGKEVAIGSTVVLRAADDSERRITILGPWNSEPEKDILSNESELAQQLLGLTRGDQADIQGITYQVSDIGPYEA